jgi:hypothetical protein
MGVLQDIEDLKGQIRKSIDQGSKERIAALLQQSFALCETIKEAVKTAGEKEKQELSQAMAGFREFLATETVRLSKKMGMTEDQMLQKRENPENFSKEQWMTLQAIKKKFSSKTKEIKEAVKANPIKLSKKASISPLKREVPENLKEFIEKNPALLKKIPGLAPPKKVAKKHVKKSKWMKS